MPTYRTYSDADLSRSHSVDGTWEEPVELVMGASRTAHGRFWIYNNTDREQRFKLDRPPLTKFVVNAPEDFSLPPGGKMFEFTVEATETYAPSTEDFVLRYFRPHSGSEGNKNISYTGVSFASWDAWASSITNIGEDEFRVEVTAHFLESGDSRFPGLLHSHLDSPEHYAKYIVGGMGKTSAAFYEGDVKAFARIIYPMALWAVNKRLFLNPLHSPLRLAPKRASLYGYAPPGLELYPPNIRRAVLYQAYDLSSMIGSRLGIIEAFNTIGLDTREVRAIRNLETHTWEIQLPQHALSIFNPDFLGQYALYHVDAYEQVSINVLGTGIHRFYTSIDFTNIAFI